MFEVFVCSVGPKNLKSWGNEREIERDRERERERERERVVLLKNGIYSD